MDGELRQRLAGRRHADGERVDQLSLLRHGLHDQALADPSRTAIDIEPHPQVPEAPPHPPAHRRPVRGRVEPQSGDERSERPPRGQRPTYPVPSQVTDPQATPAAVRPAVRGAVFVADTGEPDPPAGVEAGRERVRQIAIRAEPEEVAVGVQGLDGDEVRRDGRVVTEVLEGAELVRVVEAGDAVVAAAAQYAVGGRLEPVVEAAHRGDVRRGLERVGDLRGDPDPIGLRDGPRRHEGVLVEGVGIVRAVPDVAVADRGRAPLEPGDGHEPARVVEAVRHLAHLAPVGLVDALEDPARRLVIGTGDLAVVLARDGVLGEGGDVEPSPAHVGVRALGRPHGVSRDQRVVVEIGVHDEGPAAREQARPSRGGRRPRTAQGGGGQTPEGPRGHQPGQPSQALQHRTPAEVSHGHGVRPAARVSLPGSAEEARADPRAMLGGGPPGGGQGEASLEPQVQIVLLRVAHRPVDLQGGAARGDRGVARHRLGHRGVPRPVRVTRGERPRRAIDDRARELDAQMGVGQQVLHGLERPDGDPELVPVARVVGGELEDALTHPDELGGGGERGPVQDVGPRGVHG